MNIGLIGIVIIFGLFVVLLIINPSLSCFGKRIRSPFYPLTRKRAARKKTTDFGFHLRPDGQPPVRPEGPAKAKKPGAPKTDDYGFHLD